MLSADEWWLLAQLCAVFAIGMALWAYSGRLLHRATRKTPPRTGDVWGGDHGGECKILAIRDGVISTFTCRATPRELNGWYRYTLAGWQTHVRLRHLYLKRREKAHPPTSPPREKAMPRA